MDLSTELGPPPKKARIEIIPLIDVIFFLLATFVLFTLSLEALRVIPVPLPKSPRDEQFGPDTTVYLQASDTGTVFWKEGRDSAPETLTLAELQPRLAEYRVRAGRPRVLVRGDRAAKFGAAVQLLDEVRLAGIKEFSVETLVSPTGK